MSTYCTANSTRKVFCVLSAACLLLLHNVVCMLYSHGLPFVVVLSLLLLAVVCLFIPKEQCGICYVAHTSAAPAPAAAAAMRPAAYGCGCTNSYEKTEMCVLMFGVFSLHSTMLKFCTPWQYVMSLLQSRSLRACAEPRAAVSPPRRNFRCTRYILRYLVSVSIILADDVPFP